MKFAAALFFTLTALAQDAPEIRGIVTEYGTQLRTGLSRRSSPSQLE